MTQSIYNSESGATFSPCRAYRYTLWRRWGSERPILVVGLNPSTADETVNDATIRLCIVRAKDHGAGGLLMGNLFGYRATYPKDMKAQRDPVGPENDAALRQMAAAASIVVGAWGVDGDYKARAWSVKRLLKDYTLHAIKVTKHGHPCHPLRLPYALKFRPLDELVAGNR
ncbi:MAG: DUF1643 domain-containing protein [Planctomycetaceae bacterium]